MAKKKTRRNNLVEIARSFSYKLNIPGAYESRDFFCSQKAECKPGDAEKVSEALYQFCKSEVVKSVNGYRESVAREKNEKINAQIKGVDEKKSKDVGEETAGLDSHEDNTPL
jgi:hypothetical protein